MQHETRTNRAATATRRHVGVGATVHARKSLALIRKPRAARPWVGMQPVNV